MLEQVYNALADFLNECYPDYDIYSEYPEQDFVPPAFVIVTTGGNMQRRISDDSIYRGIDYQNYIINIFDNNLFSLIETTRDLKVRLQTIDLANGESFRVTRKNSNINVSEKHGTVTFTIPVSVTMKLKELPKFQSFIFKENMNGSEIKQELSNRSIEEEH